MNGLTEVFQFGDLNWLAVIVSAIAAFVIGGVWYNSKGRVGKAWLSEKKFTKAQMKQIEKSEAMTGVIGLTFAINLLQALVLALVLNALGIFEAVEGMLFGAVVGAVWAAGSLGVNYAYGLKTLKLFAIDAGYIVASFTVIGLVLGAWQ